MKPLTKILLTLAMALFFIGAIACVATYFISSKNLSSLGIDTVYELTEYEYEPEKKDEASETEIDFTELNVVVDRHNVVIKQSATAEQLHISYAENGYDTFTVNKIKDKLYFTNEGLQNMFFRRFCLLFDAKKEKSELNTVVVTLPMKYEGKLVVKCSNADVQFYGIAGLSEIDISGDGSDIALDYVTVPVTKVEMEVGDLVITGSVFDDLDIKLMNKANYVPIEDPDATPNPEESPEPTLEPEETVEPEATVEPEETVEPTETPVPTLKPKATPVPKELVIEKAITFTNIDFKNLTIKTTYTNITGNVVRNLLYYNVKTNNKESSNIEDYENKSSQGSITIDQTGGETSLFFK